MNYKTFFYYTLIALIFCAAGIFARRNMPENVTKKVIHKIQRKHLEWHFPYTTSTYQRKYTQEKPIVVIVPSYNNAQWFALNLHTIFFQKYKNYTVIYIADGCESTGYDGTGEYVEEYLAQHDHEKRCTLIKNKDRKGALYNLYHAIHSCPDDAIIVTLDGDDWLYHDQVFALLNDLYTENAIWLTHGRFVEYPTGRHYWSECIPEHIIKNNQFRSFKCASHCRTFYASLFKRIKVEDLMSNGEFYPMTWDQAMMFPLCEMAGEKQWYVEDHIYVYNTANQINDYKVNAQLQRDLEKEIRAKKPYNPIVDL